MCDQLRQFVQLPEKKEKTGEDQDAGENGDVQIPENARFGAKRLVRQHRGEALECVVEIEEEKQARDHEQEDGEGKKLLLRQAVGPVDERREADVNQCQEFRAFEGFAPDPLLFLEIAEQVQTVKEQAQDHDWSRHMNWP